MLLQSELLRCRLSKQRNITEAYSKPSWFRNKKHTDEQLLRRLQLWGLKQLAVGHPWRLLLLPVVVVLRPPRMSFTLCSLLLLLHRVEGGVGAQMRRQRAPLLRLAPRTPLTALDDWTAPASTISSGTATTSSEVVVYAADLPPSAADTLLRLSSLFSQSSHRSNV